MSNRLGDYVKEIRLKRNLSLRELGKLCDISHSHIDTIEKGFDFRTGKPASVTTEVLDKLARGLGVDSILLYELCIGRAPKIRSDIEYLTKEEKQIIKAFRRASPEIKNAILKILY